MYLINININNNYNNSCDYNNIIVYVINDKIILSPN